MEQFNEFVINNWYLWLALVVIVALLAHSFVGGGVSGVKKVDPTGATTLINNNSALVLDVRSEEEFAQGHIVNAAHVPLDALANPPKTLQKHKEKPVIVVCQTGSRSGRACRELRKQEFQSLFTLSGGIVAWQNASLPLSKKKK